MSGENTALVVLAHPLRDSLCAHLAATAEATLSAVGRPARLLDLYAMGFDPRLSEAERGSYYADRFDSGLPAEISDAVARAQILVLVFPAWWFGPPAILKGFIDRAFAPGLAFDHAPGFGPIRHRLGSLRHVVAAVTFGTPWWVDRLAMRRPIRRVLKTAVFATCAPQARFAYLPFYGAETADPARVNGFADKLAGCLAGLSRP